MSKAGGRSLGHQPPQSLHDPNHAQRILAAVSIQLTPNPLALSVRDIGEMHPQELQAGGAALLDCQVVVASACQCGQDGLHAGGYSTTAKLEGQESDHP